MKTKEDYINEYWEHIISDVSYNYYDDFGEDYEEQIDEWAESYANIRMKEQEENNKELAKYKRAFEILKDELSLELIQEENKNVYCVCLTWADRVFISKEKYELLEELMKDAKD